MTILRYTFIAFLIIALNSCGDKADKANLNVIKIQINSEPDMLNPAISRKSISSQIESQMYLPLAEVDALTGEWRGVLLSDWQVDYSTDSVAYLLTLKSAAQWSDGVQVTSQDILYTLTMGLNPFVANQAWAAYLSLIDRVTLTKEGLKMVLGQPYILSDEFIASLTVYPAHHLDQDQTVSIDLLNTLLSGSSLQVEQENLLKQLADSFNVYGGINESHTVVNGPYTIREWIANQKIVLDRVDAWWGDRELTSMYPNEGPSQLQFVVIENEENALNSFVQDEVDVLNLLREKDTLLIEEYGGEVISVPNLQVLYISLNNEHELLSDIDIRRALNFAVNRADMVKKLFSNSALPATGPIHPSKYYYVNTDGELDLSQAKKLLADKGCIDSNGDGILDCKVEGKWRPLEFDIWTTRSTLSKNVATLLKSYWMDLGVELTIHSADFRSFLPELQQKTYDMAALALRQNNIKDDPYPLWHSTQAGATGKNYQAVKDHTLDSIMDDLRISLDFQDQMALYQRFQERFSEIQPVIFLVAPVDIIAVKKNIDLQLSPHRPGYDVGRSHIKK